MPTAAFVSFRLGGTDGVSIESSKWASALEGLGFDVITVAGEGPVDHLVDGLAISAQRRPDRRAVQRALEGADLVVVENLCSLPLNRAAGDVVAQVCARRPTILHHHDLAWQRPGLGSEPPPDDEAWRHVTINDLSRRELATRGIDATTIYNRFDTSAPEGERDRTRSELGVGPGERLVLQPTRALARKNVGAALSIARALRATYWLLGPPEDGYGAELERLVRSSGCRVLQGPSGSRSVADAYAASDLVLLPSTWEGFGNPSVESAVHRRPLCIGPYPVARELAAFGFEWFSIDEHARMERWFAAPDASMLQRNWEVADDHFSLRELPRLIGDILTTFPGLA